MTLKTQRVRTLDQVRAFLDGSESVDFADTDREGVYALVRGTLVRLNHHRLGKPDKGLVKRYLGKVTGLSRPQLTRLIGQHRAIGRIANRRARAPAAPAACTPILWDSNATAFDFRSPPAHGIPRSSEIHPNASSPLSSSGSGPGSVRIVPSSKTNVAHPRRPVNRARHPMN